MQERKSPPRVLLKKSVSVLINPPWIPFYVRQQSYSPELEISFNKCKFKEEKWFLKAVGITLFLSCKEEIKFVKQLER